MQATINLDQLKEKFEEARNKYRPEKIKILLIAEAPPDSLDRFFYFERVAKQDSLLSIILNTKRKSG